MPAHTVAQLQEILGSGAYAYFDPDGSFLGALRQVYPRLVDMGLWRDMAYEVSLSGAKGYVSLPADTDAVLACTINDFPRNTRSQWHDIRITGRQATVSEYYGIVDDGFHPVLLDLSDLDTYDDEVGVNNLLGFLAGSSTAATDTFTGTITIVTNTINGVGTLQTLTSEFTPGIQFTGGDEFTRIVEIRYDECNVSVDIVDPHGDHQVIATVPTGSGVLRFRRFRTSNKTPDSTVHLLVKRGAPSHITEDTVIHLGNIGAIKHGLLGLIAEDNADLERANFHWGMAGKLLDQELASMFGSAKPSFRFHDPAASGVSNFY